MSSSDRPTDDPDVVAFSRAVRAARKKSGKTGLELGIEAEVDAAVITRIERGSGCNLRTAVRLARALNFSLDEVTGL